MSAPQTIDDGQADGLGDASATIEALLRRPDGPATVLVVGGRSSGKTRTCEAVLARLDCEVVRWGPYAEMTAGDVTQQLLGRPTVVFVDDADQLVTIVKGASVELVAAMRNVGLHAPRRMLLTAAGTKGRVWRAVAKEAVEVVYLPTAPSTQRPAPPPPTRLDWGAAARLVDRVMAVRGLRNRARSSSSVQGEESTEPPGAVGHGNTRVLDEIADALE